MLEGLTASCEEYVTGFQASLRTGFREAGRYSDKITDLVTGPCLLDLRHEKFGSLNATKTYMKISSTCFHSYN